MILFFVGIIEMVIAAAWTKSVSKAKVASTGVITTVNIFIWYYVIRTVVDNLENWTAIIPYAAGCAIGAMLGAALDGKGIRRAPAKRTANRLGEGRGYGKVVQPMLADDSAYETIR